MTLERKQTDYLLGKTGNPLHIISVLTSLPNFCFTFSNSQSDPSYDIIIVDIKEVMFR